MPSRRHSAKKKRQASNASSEAGPSKSAPPPTPECTCEASSSCISGPSSSTCRLHRPFPESEIEFYEHMEQLRDQEYELRTNTHEKRMKYFRKELVEYLDETAWKYKPIEFYIK